MVKRLKTIGWILIAMGLFKSIGTTSEWLFQPDPLPIALADLIRDIGVIIAAIICGLALLKAPDEPWRWHELFALIVRYTAPSHRIILIICVLLVTFAMLFSVPYSIICIAGKMCR